MQTEIPTYGGNSRLILFFNGWSTPSSVVKHLKAEAGTTVAVVYDYSSRELTFDLSPYREIHLVAWSMGVFAAGQVLRCIPLASATAINGTPHPVDDERGIPTAIFRGTQENLSDDTLTRFTRRMCGNAAARTKYGALEEARPLASLRNELKSIAEWYEAAPSASAPFPWTQALLGRDDRIFPFTNQERYWATVPCTRRSIDAPHYPFYLWNEWKQILPR